MFIRNSLSHQSSISGKGKRQTATCPILVNLERKVIERSQAGTPCFLGNNTQFPTIGCHPKNLYAGILESDLYILKRQVAAIKLRFVVLSSPDFFQLNQTKAQLFFSSSSFLGSQLYLNTINEIIISQ